MIKNNQGFTLIELLVSMSIFAIIATGTGGAVSRGTKVKKRVEQQWQNIHGIRTATSILKRDISLAFHIQNPKKQGQFLAAPQDDSLWFKTYFFGKNDQMSFTSISNRRLYANVHESELCEIVYSLSADEDNPEQLSIFRRKSAIVDDNKERGGEPLAILENVKELKFKYYSQKKTRWFEDWDSTNRDFTDQFPDAVEIKFTVIRNKNEKEYTKTILLSNPNNEKPQNTAKKPADKKVPVNDPNKDKEGDAFNPS